MVISSSHSIFSSRGGGCFRPPSLLVCECISTPSMWDLYFCQLSFCQGTYCLYSSFFPGVFDKTWTSTANIWKHWSHHEVITFFRCLWWYLYSTMLRSLWGQNITIYYFRGWNIKISKVDNVSATITRTGKTVIVEQFTFNSHGLAIMRLSVKKTYKGKECKEKWVHVFTKCICLKWISVAIAKFCLWFNDSIFHFG